MPYVSQLYVYPVKSLKGIQVHAANMTSRGFEHDRRWMLIDENNKFLSQRTLPQLTFFEPIFTAAGLHITHPDDRKGIVIPYLPSSTNADVDVTIWDDKCSGQLVDQRIDDWFSRILNMPCRLIYMPDHSRRQVDLRYAPEGQITSFTDAYPLLTISEASLNDLNNRLSSPLLMNRFRPNIVIAGCEPYWEDRLARFTINTINFIGVKLCARCSMIGVNQLTGATNAEPLKTLSKYRKRNNKVYFGQNLIHQGEGLVNIGDLLKQVELKDSASFDTDR